MYVLGYDIGSSSVKASLVNVESGKCAAYAFFPKTEAPILAVKQGWAEQDPQSWWNNLKLATQAVLTASGAKAEEIKAIGISYQMHGLVCVDKNDDFTDAKVPRILIERNIKFLDLEKTPLPPPAFGCAFIPDLSPESIEAARAEAMHDLLRKRGC